MDRIKKRSIIKKVRKQVSIGENGPEYSIVVCAQEGDVWRKRLTNNRMYRAGVDWARGRKNL